MPTFDCGDDLIEICAPDVEFRVFICFGEESFDGGLEIDERTEDAAFASALGQLGEVSLDGVEL